MHASMQACAPSGTVRHRYALARLFCPCRWHRFLAVPVKLALSGHRILFLGARTPVDSLLDMIQEHQPDIVCISVILPVTPSEATLFARSLLAVSDGKIMFGGAGLPSSGMPKMERVSWVYN